MAISKGGDHANMDGRQELKLRANVTRRAAHATPTTPTNDARAGTSTTGASGEQHQDSKASAANPAVRGARPKKRKRRNPPDEMSRGQLHQQDGRHPKEAITRRTVHAAIMRKGRDAPVARSRLTTGGPPLRRGITCCQTYRDQ